MRRRLVRVSAKLPETLNDPSSPDRATACLLYILAEQNSASRSIERVNTGFQFDACIRVRYLRSS